MKNRPVTRWCIGGPKHGQTIVLPSNCDRCRAPIYETGVQADGGPISEAKLPYAVYRAWCVQRHRLEPVIVFVLEGLDQATVTKLGTEAGII